MAEKIVSPGVFTRENDLSFLAQGVANIGTAFIGPFKEGPLTPTIVNSQTEFEQLFGRVDDTYYTPLAVQAYLREAGAATICRVAGVGGYKETNPVLLTMYKSGSNATSASVGIIFNTSDTIFSAGLNVSQSSNGIASASVSGVSAGRFVFNGTNITPTWVSLNPADVNDIEAYYGTNPAGTNGAYVYGYFSKAATDIYNLYTTASNVSMVTLPSQSFTQNAQTAKSPFILSQNISGERYKLFQFETIGAGAASNKKVKVAITNIKKAGSVSGTDYGTFTVVVRDFNDTNDTKVVLETYSNVTLDPVSVNYIYRVIGDRNITIDSTGKVTETGDWLNKSKYIRLVNSQRERTLKTEKIPVQAIPAAHTEYYLPVSGSGSVLSTLLTIPAVSFINADEDHYGGIDLDNNSDNNIYLKPLPVSPITGSNTTFALDDSSGSNLDLTQTDATEVSKRNLLVAFQGGWDGLDPKTPIYKGKDIVEGNTQGFDCGSLTSSGSIAYLKQIAALSNADEYDIQMIVTPGLIYTKHYKLMDAALDMVTDRGDAFYIMEGVGMDPAADTINEARKQAGKIDSNYAGMYYPWVKTIDVTTSKLIAVPPSVLLPAVYAANDRVAAEWFAPAGLNRGGLSGAIAVLNKLTQTDRDNLYEDKVNPIVQFPGQGIVAFGQKTLQARPSALDRINVRRLLLKVRKYVASTSRYLIFEQNTSTTRNKFINIVNPYLQDIQQKQGLYAFKVVMDESNNTPDSIDRNFLNGSIYLQPTRTAEFIQIDFNILPTGAKFGG